MYAANFIDEAVAQPQEWIKFWKYFKKEWCKKYDISDWNISHLIGDNAVEGVLINPLLWNASTEP
jgi:hypothetical protein